MANVAIAKARCIADEVPGTWEVPGISTLQEVE